MSMFRKRRVIIIWLLAVLTGVFWQVGLAAGQVPGDGEESNQPEVIIQVTLAELQVQGEQEPEAVREGFSAILPALAACLQGEQRRLGKVPARLTVRFNLSGSGKVVWTKLTDPPLKSLEACLGKALASLRLPPTGTSLSRATAVLECRTDHLLTP